MSVLAILLGAAACLVSCLAAGLGAVRMLRIELNRGECICLGYCLGTAIVSTLTLALACLYLARESVFVLLSIAALVSLFRLIPWLRRREPTQIKLIPVFYRLLFVAVWIVFGCLYFRYALAPERSPDGIAYHLGLVNHWNHAHGMFRIIDMYAALPDGIEMLYLFAFSIGRHSAASLVHFSFLMLLPLMMISYGLRFGFRGSSAVFAALVVFVTPLVGWDGSVAYNDVALAAVVMATVYFLQLWRSRRQTGYLIASSLLAGFAFAIKYTGGVMLLLVMGTVVSELWRKIGARTAKALLVSALVMAIAPVPYLVRNWMWFRDPIAFFGNSVFRNPYFHVMFEREYVLGQQHLNGIRWRDVPRELTLGGPKLPDNLGPFYLLMPLALAGLVWRPSRYLVIAGLVVGCTYAGNKSARFLIPALPLLALAVAYTLSRIPFARRLTGILVLCQVVLCWPSVVASIQMPKVPGPRLDQVSWDVALRAIPEEQYLTRTVDEYSMARQIDRLVPEGQKVFVITGGVAQSYTTHVIVDSFRSAEAQKFTDMLFSSLHSPYEAGRQWTATFPPTTTRQLRIVQTASSNGQWIISELLLWRGDQLIPPSEKWRKDAFPNPSDVGLMLDGDEATHWKSWEPLAPGMYIDIRFNTAQMLDRLELRSDDGQWFSKMDAQLQNDKGEWVHPISKQWAAEKPVDLRKAAMQALKRQGVGYLVISRTTWNEQKFRGEPAVWGMHEVVSTKGATLYRID